MFARKIFVCSVLFIATLFAGVITARITANSLEFDGNTPIIQGFNKLQIPGTPILPAKSIVLALPAGARVFSVVYFFTGFTALL